MGKKKNLESREQVTTKGMQSESRVSRKKSRKKKDTKEMSIERTSEQTQETAQSHIDGADKNQIATAHSPLPDDEIAKTLNYHHWYHGMMPRHEIEDLLKNDGDFLVRKTDVGNKARYAISVFYNKRIRHILLNYEDGMWVIRNEKKKTIIELIEHLRESKTPLQVEGTILNAGVPCPDYYILHELIEVGKKLGGGAFGDVHIGVWKKGFDDKVEVAIKKLKGKMQKKERAEFVKEAKIMRKFNHPNLVQLIGICPNESPMMIILELCPGGSLQSHLKKHPDLKEEKLTQYCTDACRGMVYLSLRKVIHRDIAARNCLLGKNDECKISDFGLSVANTEVLKLDKLKSMPIRWLSPETLKKGEFSTKSDVWSFGIMMWEIFTHCKTDPFPGMSNAEARSKIISGSEPFEPPESMPTVFNAVMKLCFTQDTDKRPDFLTLFKLMAPHETPPTKEEKETKESSLKVIKGKVND